MEWYLLLKLLYKKTTHFDNNAMKTVDSFTPAMLCMDKMTHFLI